MSNVRQTEPKARTGLGHLRPLRVASVPSDHVYVRHLAPVRDRDGATPVTRLPDPTRPWWPPAMLDAQWVRAHAAEFDLMHVHFGFDGLAPATLADITAALAECSRPLVLTVHDLRNPHHRTRHLHDAQLDVLMLAAQAVLTLTPGAAREIRTRWGRDAVVVPHPHVVDLPTLRGWSRPRRLRAAPFVVGVHFKSLRPCMAGAPVVAALIDAFAGSDRFDLRFNVHCDVADPDGERHDAELVRELARARRRGARVDVHDFFSDAELWNYLAGLDLSVLPYRFGTHSGWLEACRDLGTAVAAPRCGYYAEQGPVYSFDLDEDGLDVASLVQAVRAAATAERPTPVSAAERAAQRDEVARVHAELYAELLA